MKSRIYSWRVKRHVVRMSRKTGAIVTIITDGQAFTWRQAFAKLPEASGFITLGRS